MLKEIFEKYIGVLEHIILKVLYKKDISESSQLTQYPLAKASVGFFLPKIWSKKILKFTWRDTWNKPTCTVPCDRIFVITEM